MLTKVLKYSRNIVTGSTSGEHFMKIVRKVRNRIVSMRLSYAQVLFIAIAFALMAFVSYSYGNSREQYHLMRRAEDALTNAQTYIEINLRESKSTLIGMSDAARYMIANAASASEVQNYFSVISATMLVHDSVNHGTSELHGEFECFGEKLLIGASRFLPDDFNFRELPWYDDVVKANGEVFSSQPYLSELYDEYIITYARIIFDDDKNELGILWLDVSFASINEYVINTRLTDDGYSLLLDINLDVIGHPIPAYLGRNISLLNDGDIIAADMRSGAIFGTFDARAYDNTRSELVWKVFDNDWVLCLMTPYDTYYQSVQDMAWYLGILGFVFAVALSIVLLSVTSAKIKSDEESKQKSNFLATVSHEIRTPLNAIIGVTEIELLDKSLSPELRDAFSRIYNSGYSLLTIINDLLDLSKIEAGKIELSPARYEVSSLINDTIHYTLFREDNKPLEFELIVDEDLPVSLIGDEIRIKQILNNLVSNAYKYTDKGKISLHVESVKSESGEHSIVFTVKDTGYGMSADQLSKLFDAYTRFMTQNAYGSVGGTGLGMNITKRLLDMMNGTITVKSVLGEGSTFIVQIPQATDSDEVIGSEMAKKLMNFSAVVKTSKSTEDFSRDFMPYGTVLVVDDMESNLYVAEGLLAPYGLKLSTAASGQEAIELINNGNEYDIILMDHMMPIMDGMETTIKIREGGYDKPIVALTANAMQGQAELFLSKGFDDFLSKPVDIRHLDLTLNRFIRDKQPQDVIDEARRQKQSNAISNIIEIVDTKLTKDTIAKNRTPPTGVIVDSELARLFVVDCSKVVDSLESIMDKLKEPSDEELRKFESGMHAAKSALSHIGESDMSHIALRLEQAARNRDMEIINISANEFIKELRAVIERLRAENEDAYASLSDEDKSLLGDMWFDVYSACITKDAEEVTENLEKMKERSWPSAIAEAISAVTDSIAKGDFQAAVDIAERESNRSM